MSYYPYYPFGYSNYYPWFIPTQYYMPYPYYDYQQGYSLPYLWYGAPSYGFAPQFTSYYPYPYSQPYEQITYPYYPMLPTSYIGSYGALPMLPSY